MPYVYQDPDGLDYTDDIILNNYLQIEHKSDEALEYLISYFQNYDEKVILLFFGDHQPNMENETLINDEENKYKVPYLIWANYDIEKKEYGDTSANFLQSILMETADIPQDAYTNYISNLRKEIPVITSHYYIGTNGIKYNYNDEESPYYEKIDEYRKVIYYQMFEN